jgi:hypothetical protein
VNLLRMDWYSFGIVGRQLQIVAIESSAMAHRPSWARYHETSFVWMSSTDDWTRTAVTTHALAPLV